MAITISMAIVATMIITDIGAITASTGLRANCIQYNYWTCFLELITFQISIFGKFLVVYDFLGGSP